jgi:hypothetical protein
MGLSYCMSVRVDYHTGSRGNCTLYRFSIEILRMHTHSLVPFVGEPPRFSFRIAVRADGRILFEI